HGCVDIPTPHIDRIATEGVRFTDAYANASFCTPTRVALMSCRYQQRTGNDDLPQVTGPLPLSVNTLSDRLKASGYLTGMVGKWHLGSGAGYEPLKRGFDEFFGFLGGGHTYFPDRPQRGSYGSPIFRQSEPSGETRYLTDAFGAEAAAFLKRHRDSEKPLFLYLAFNAVHTPMHATERYLKRFPNLSGSRKTYAAMLSAMDDAIGEVLNELDASGKADDTLVIFHNDNGGPTTRNAVNGSNNAPLRGSKCETFEGGIRVPLFLRWPGKLEAGSVYRKPVMTFDLSATALQLAKADAAGIDGKDLLPYLAGQIDGAPHETLFWRCRTRNNNYAVRHGDWKYVYSTEGSEQPGPKQTLARDMLFRLSGDLGEKKDLSTEYPEKLRELKALFAAWDAEMDADCQAAGIAPPRVRGPAAREPAYAQSASFPGFDVLSGVGMKKTSKGYLISSNADGLALQKLATPLKGIASFSLDITPRASSPNNGFFVFGKDDSNAATTKCGLLVGGNRVVIYHGPYGSKSSGINVPLTGGKTYPVTAQIDVPASRVSMTAAGKTVSHVLPRTMDEIRYIGYGIVRANGEFSEIKDLRR
ncbi:MAG: arylsulfatase A-like enzyme, partial [Rhodothermales bacterium]